MQRAFFLVLLTVAASQLVADCGLEAEARPAPPNVVFVVADTLRRDHVGVYSNQPSVTPFLDSLAARAVVFDRAYAQSPWTNPSVASMFTSRYCSQHLILSFGSRLAEEERTLAEVFHEHGYATGGFTANVLVHSGLGFGQGFDEFRTIGSPQETAHPKGPGASINKAALDWIDSVAGRTDPVFLYVHYMEPHIPFDAPEEVLLEVLDGRPLPDVAAINRALFARPKNLTPEELESAKLLYGAGVADLDRQVRQLFDGLQQRGILEHSVFVFTADHGEEMGERGWWGHGMSLYNEVVQVPLLLGTVGRKQREDVGPNVGLVDIAPTLLELAAIPAPDTFEGRVLPGVGIAEPVGASQRLIRFFFDLWTEETPVISELLYNNDESHRPTFHQRAVMVGTRKLIRSRQGPSEFYDLRRDPSEMSATRGFDGIPSSMQFALDAFLGRVGPRSVAQTAPVLDAKTRERMQALGYVE